MDELVGLKYKICGDNKLIWKKLKNNRMNQKCAIKFLHGFKNKYVNFNTSKISFY